jgi:hypothetical protein
MRFAFALQSQTPLQRSALEGVRPVRPVLKSPLFQAVKVSVQPAAAAAPFEAPASGFDQLPDDLDQRVRLVGEW